MIVTLLVGKFSDVDIHRLIQSYTTEFPVIISTWKDQVTEEHVKALEKSNFDLVLSDYISEDFSINIQLKTIQVGLSFINDKYEYDMIVKSRTDIYPINYSEFISSVYFDTNKLSVLYYINLNLLYYLDLIVIGNKENINKFFNIPNSPNNVYPELYLINNYSGYTPIEYSYEYYNNHFNFIGNILKEKDIDFVWERNVDNFDKMPMDFLENYKDKIEKEDYSVNLIKDLSKAPYIISP